SLLLLSVLPHPSPSALPLLSLHDALPISIWIGASKLYKLANGIPNTLIALNPWFYISLTVMILGTLLFIAGFLGELILRNQRNSVRYRIDQAINANKEDFQKIPTSSTPV